MRLFTKIIGEKSCSIQNPIVILHGLFGSHRNWQAISSILSQRLACQTVSVDLRNHGQSVQFTTSPSTNGDAVVVPTICPIGEKMTWDLMAEDVSQIITRIGRPVTLMGHSLGGLVAMQTAQLLARLNCPSSEHLNLIDRMIIVDIAPRALPFIGSTQERYLLEMKRLDLLGLSRPNAMKEFIKTEPDEQIVQFLFTNYGTLQKSSLAGSTSPVQGRYGFLIPLDAIHQGMIKLSNSFAMKGAIPIPTLIVKGGASDYISSDQQWENTFQDYNLKIVDGAGHWPHYSHPREFIDLTTSWLSLTS